MQVLHSNNHSYFALYYQLILVSKNQKPIFNEKVINFLIEQFKKYSTKYHIEYISLSFEKDHIHIDFKAEPKSELVKFINAFKSATSKTMKKEFPEILSLLTDNSIWEKTYFLVSNRVPTDDVVKKFIKMKLNCNK